MSGVATPPTASHGGDFAQGEDCGELAGRLAERADVIAFVEARIAGAEQAIAKRGDQNEEVRMMRRALRTLVGDLQSGMHLAGTTEGEEI